MISVIWPSVRRAERTNSACLLFQEFAIAVQNALRERTDCFISLGLTKHLAESAKFAATWTWPEAKLSALGGGKPHHGCNKTAPAMPNIIIVQNLEPELEPFASPGV